MGKSFSILYVSSEVYPFAKVGGLGDVAYSLPLAIREVGHDIRVMLPKYGHVSERKNRIHDINRLKDLPITIGNKTELATVKSSSMSNPKVKVQAYIVTNSSYFENLKGFYSDPKTGLEFENNDERFIFFNRIVIETCLILGWTPDIIHCNDWQSGIIPAYVKTLFPNKFKKTKIVLTIHNFNKQGIFPESTFKKTGLHNDIKENFIHKGQFNFLKGAIYYADYINTVSPGYAQEILQDNTYSNELNQLLLEKSDKFKGILNGIDTWTWNPKTDEKIPYNFVSDYTEFKVKNKTALMKEFNLDGNSSLLTSSDSLNSPPLIGMIIGLDKHSGIDLFLESADSLLQDDIRIVILGEGDVEIKNKLKKLAKKYEGKFAFKSGFDDSLAHLIEAGSDIFLIPSDYEPCGLNAMYSANYGSLPVVRCSGGLNNIISDYDPKNKTGNGIIIGNKKPEDLTKAIKRALALYQDKKEWVRLATENMKSNFSWDKSVKLYDEIYRGLMKD